MAYDEAAGIGAHDAHAEGLDQEEVSEKVRARSLLSTVFSSRCLLFSLSLLSSVFCVR